MMTDSPKKSQPKRNTHTIEIKLEVPQFEKAEAVAKKTHQQAKKLWQYKSFKFSVAGVFVIIVALMTVNVLASNQSDDVVAVKPGTSPLVKQDVDAKVPYYDTLLPAGKTIEQLGGWTRSSPTDRNAGFVYVDYIRVNRLTINQQVLPEDFKVDTKVQMEAIAKSLSASEILTVEGLTVYIATSSKGPQTVIFNKNGLLVFLRSNVKLSNDDWIGYINSLQ
jgi:hypothetical protein